MRVFLDNAPLESDVASGTLADALEAVQVEAGTRLIVEVNADGTPVPADHLSNPPATSPYCDELTCVSADRAAIVRVSFGEAADLLGSMSEQYGSIVELIQVGKTQDGLHALSEIFMVWQSIEQTLQNGRRIDGISFESSTSDGSIEGMLDGTVAELAAVLREIKDAVVSGDFTTVADIVEHDLGQLSTDWQNLLNRLADSVRLGDTTHA